MPSHPSASPDDSPESPEQQQNIQTHQKQLSGESIMSFMTAPESQEPEVTSVTPDTKAPSNESGEKLTTANKNKNTQRKRKDCKKQIGRSRKASKVTDLVPSDNPDPTSGASGNNTAGDTRRNSNTTSGTSDKSKKGRNKMARGPKNKKNTNQDKGKEKETSPTMSKQNGQKNYYKVKDKHEAFISPDIDPARDETYPENFKISVMCCESLWYTNTDEYEEHSKSKPLTEHCQMFSEDKRPECKSCDIKFGTIWNFRRHMRSTHSRDLHRFQQEMQIFFACKKALNPPTDDSEAPNVLDHPVVCCGSKFENVCHLETHLDNVHNMPDWYHKKEKVDAMMQCKESFERYLDLVRKEPGIDPNAMSTYQIAERHFLDATNGIISGWNQNASWQDRRDFQEDLSAWGEAEQATWGPVWSGVGPGGFTPQDFRGTEKEAVVEATRGRQMRSPHDEPSSGNFASSIVLEEGADGCVHPGPAYTTPDCGRARSFDARYQPGFSQPIVLETPGKKKKGFQTPPAPQVPNTPPQVATTPLGSPPPLPSVHATPRRLRKHSPVQLMVSPMGPGSPISPDHPMAFMNQIPERLQYKASGTTGSPAAKDRYMVYGQDRNTKIPRPILSVQSPVQSIQQVMSPIQPMQQIQSPVQSIQPIQLVPSMEQLLSEHHPSSHPQNMSFRNNNSTNQGRGGKKSFRKNKNGRRSPESFQQGHPGYRENQWGFDNKQNRPFQPQQQSLGNQTYLGPPLPHWQPHHFNKMGPGHYLGLSAPSPSQTVMSIHSGPPVFDDPPHLSGRSSQHSGGHSLPFHGEPQTPQFASHAQAGHGNFIHVPVANMMAYASIPSIGSNAPLPDASLNNMNAPWTGFSAQAKEFVPSLTAGGLIRSDRRHASNESLDTNPNEIRNDPQGWTDKGPGREPDKGGW